MLEKHKIDRKYDRILDALETTALWLSHSQNCTVCACMGGCSWGKEIYRRTIDLIHAALADYLGKGETTIQN